MKASLNRFEGGFVDLQRQVIANVRGERVPEGGCSNTESPIPKGVKSGVWDGEQAGVRGAQGPGCGVEMEEVRQVPGDKAVEGLVCEEKDFIFDAVLDQEPVEVNEGGGEVLPGPGTSENPGS